MTIEAAANEIVNMTGANYHEAVMLARSIAEVLSAADGSETTNELRQRVITHHQEKIEYLIDTTVAAMDDWQQNLPTPRAEAAENLMRDIITFARDIA